MAREDGVGGFVRRHIVPIRWLSLPIVAASAYIVWQRMWPDPTLMPQPRLLFIADKTYVTPMRLIQFLALIALFSATYPYIKRWASWLVELRLAARAQFADRVLRRLAAQSCRADHTLRLPWRYRGRHGRGNIGHRNHGVFRMASGMARTGQVKRLGAAVAGVLTASLIAGAVFGEGTTPAAPAAPAPPVAAVPMPAPYSPECQGGSTEIVTESPLPNVAAALQKRRTVRILAIGNSAGRRHGGYTRADRAHAQAGGQRRRRRDHQSRRLGRARRQRLAADQERSRDDQPRSRDLAGRHRRRARLRAAR